MNVVITAWYTTQRKQEVTKEFGHSIRSFVANTIDRGNHYLPESTLQFSEQVNCKGKKEKDINSSSARSYLQLLCLALYNNLLSPNSSAPPHDSKQHSHRIFMMKGSGHPNILYVDCSSPPLLTGFNFDTLDFPKQNRSAPYAQVVCSCMANFANQHIKSFCLSGLPIGQACMKGLFHQHDVFASSTFHPKANDKMRCVYYEVMPKLNIPKLGGEHEKLSSYNS